MPKKQVRLIVNYFAHHDSVRADEIQTCFLRNINNRFIDEIVVIAQSERPAWLTGVHKIHWLDVDETECSHGRPNFSHFFRCARERLSSPYDITIVANSDIWFDESLANLRGVSLENSCLSLSRYEDDGTNVLAGDNSQDVWIFQGPIRPILNAAFPMGLFCCDWRLAWEIVHAGYRLLNPCYTIKCWHLHNSPLRNIVAGIIPGPHLNRIHQQSLDTCCLMPPHKHMAGIIGMSLWGDIPKYCVGAIRNAEMIRQIYPGWRLRIYHDDTVPSTVLSALNALQVDLVLKERSDGCSGMFWRFEVADDPSYEFWAVRDTDSRFSYRERRAVDAWVESKKAFHIMNDHPGHGKPIMGGAFGGVRGVVEMRQLIAGWERRTSYGDDERFLAERIYPLILFNVCLHHWDRFVNSPFPSAREDGQFMLGITFEDEFFDHDHRHWLLDIEAERHGIYTPPCSEQDDEKQRAILRQLNYSHEWTTAATHIEELYEKVKPYRCGKAIEVGSFKGHGTLALALAGLQVESWDISEEHRMECEMLLKSHDLDVCWRTGHGGQAVLEHGQIDVVFHDAEHGKHIVPELLQFWNNRILKGGMLIVHDVEHLDLRALVSDLNPASWSVTLDSKRRQMGYFVKSELPH